MPFFNTEHVGPVVLEIPPGDNGVFNGSVMNYWQTAIEDVGPGGVDEGEGMQVNPPSGRKSGMVIAPRNGEHSTPVECEGSGDGRHFLKANG
jgi:hypothetical protein